MDFEKTQINQNQLVGTLIKDPSYDEAKALWESAAIENENIFLSWIWLGPWLEAIQNHANVSLFVVRQNEDIVATVFFVLQNQRRKKLITSRQLHINELCKSPYNMIIEYNGIAIKPGMEEPVYDLFCDFLQLNSNWDEFVINAIPFDAYEQLKKRLNLDTEIMNQGMSRQAFLEPDKHDTSQSLKQSLLSSNKRSQINRSIKYIQKLHGDITVDLADSTDKAIEYFDQLGELHTNYWRKKGLPGSFANQNWVEFNKKIIRNGFDKNQIQLFHIHCGDFTIGYLYNLVYKNKIYNVQSGFNYLEDNKFKPGFISHWLAIEYCWQKGIEVYDFLAGGEEYKKSFANNEIELIWLKFKRPKLSFTIEKILKTIWRKIKR